MSTRKDMEDAKAAFASHVAGHKCVPVTIAVARGQVPCAERAPLWKAYMEISGRWGTESSDKARMEEQYREQTAKIGQ